jgi:hypothetical protein
LVGRTSRGIVSSVQVSFSADSVDASLSDFVLHSVIDPFKVIKTGPGYDITGDPLKPLEAELAAYKYVSIPEVPTFTGERVFTHPRVMACL